MRALFTFACCLAVVGCGNGGPLSPNVVENFTRLGGCVDVIFYAVDAQDRLMLRFRADGLVNEAQSAGEETVTTFQLPSTEAELILEQGTNVSDATCDDAIEGDGPQVARSWTAVAGTATVHVRPEPDAGGARADLLLEGVLLESATGDEVPLSRLEWSDIHVGWYPG